MERELLTFTPHSPRPSAHCGPERRSCPAEPRATSFRLLPRHSLYHPHMTIDMESLAWEGAKARLWQLETETNELLRVFLDLRDGQHSQTTSQDGSVAGAE